MMSVMAKCFQDRNAAHALVYVLLVRKNHQFWLGHDRSGTATRRGFRSQVRQGVMHCRQKDVAKRKSEFYWQSHLPQT